MTIKKGYEVKPFILIIELQTREQADIGVTKL